MMGVLEVFGRFLALGFISFGGPAAHLGIFRTTFVSRLRWMDDDAFTRLIALSQFLPGPGSSQVGFAIGLHRAGLAGALAAFLGFTAPSFVLMALVSRATVEGAFPGFLGVVHGLKLLAVIVVADATLGMFRTFCRTRVSLSIFFLTTGALLAAPVLAVSGLAAQFAALGVAAVVGARGMRPDAGGGDAPAAAESVRPRGAAPASRGRGALPLALFGILFALALWPGRSPLVVLAPFAPFYEAGSLVFGGGHVVLPLLQETLGDTVATDRFLLGYSAAQAVPGPMFTFATFLGAELRPDDAWRGALLATAGIFLPGFLLVLGLRNSWERLLRRPGFSGAAAGLNAAVVGLLLAAWIRPIVPSAVNGPLDVAVAAAGWWFLRQRKAPIVALVAGFAVAGVLLHLVSGGA
jgi:chromate transporter